MGADITVSRNLRQRHAVTGFRSNDAMANPPIISNEPKTFGERVRARRKFLNIERNRLAADVGIPYTTLATIESSISCTTPVIDLLAAALDTTCDYLRNGGDPKSTNGSNGERQLTSAERYFVEKYRRLSVSEREKVEIFMLGISSAAPGKSEIDEKPTDLDAMFARSERSG